METYHTVENRVSLALVIPEKFGIKITDSERLQYARRREKTFRLSDRPRLPIESAFWQGGGTGSSGQLGLREELPLLDRAFRDWKWSLNSGLSN